MKIKERLLECKIKTGLKSDYALAGHLGIPRQAISELMQGKRHPDAFIAVKIADVLGIHPMMLLAEFEAEKAKTKDRQGFWLNFERRIKNGAVAMLVLISTAFWLPERKAEASALDTHNA